MGKKKKEYICKCYKLTKKDLKDKVKEGYTDFKLVQKELKIGTSCSSCKKKSKKRFQKYLDKYNENEVSTS